MTSHQESWVFKVVLRLGLNRVGHLVACLGECPTVDDLKKAAYRQLSKTDAFRRGRGKEVSHGAVYDESEFAAWRRISLYHNNTFLRSPALLVDVGVGQYSEVTAAFYFPKESIPLEVFSLRMSTVWSPALLQQMRALTVSRVIYERFYTAIACFTIYAPQLPAELYPALVPFYDAYNLELVNNLLPELYHATRGERKYLQDKAYIRLFTQETPAALQLYVNDRKYVALLNCGSSCFLSANTLRESKLQSLWMSGVQVLEDALPKTLEQLELKETNIALTYSSLVNIKELVLQRVVNIGRPFDSCKHIPNMTSITLIQCHQLYNSVPEDLEYLDKLQEFKICQHDITCVPSSINRLRSLTSLTMSSISKDLSLVLSEELCELESLTHLSLPHNGIRALPEAIGRLPLKTLLLEHNHLTQLPHSFSQLTMLERLQLYSNHLVSFDVSVNAPLTDIDVSHNELVSVPDSLQSIPSLRIFNVSYNYQLSQFVSCLSRDMQFIGALGTNIHFEKTAYLDRVSYPHLSIQCNRFIDIDSSIEKRRCGLQ